RLDQHRQHRDLNAVTFATETLVTLYEETDAAVSYSPTGPWITRGSGTATFTFTGTAVSWIGLRCNICGIASVSIDGGVASTVDIRPARLRRGPCHRGGCRRRGLSDS